MLNSPIGLYHVLHRGPLAESATPKLINRTGLSPCANQFIMLASS